MTAGDYVLIEKCQLITLSSLVLLLGCLRFKTGLEACLADPRKSRNHQTTEFLETHHWLQESV